MNEGSSKCIACGSGRYRVRIKQATFEIRECRSCRMAWTSPPSVVTLASYESDPDFAARYVSIEEKSIHYANALFDSVANSLRGKTLLDVGCSIGMLVEAANRRGFKAEGIDLDENAIEYGRGKDRAIYATDLRKFDHPPYDVICLQHTLEHVLQPVAFLQECARHLSENGCVIISLPCHDGWVPRIFNRRWYGWQFTQHYFHYSAEALRHVLAAAGFGVEKCFQNSMDHGIQTAWRPLKQAITSRLFYHTAQLGNLLGHGDQLIAVGRLAVNHQ